MLFIHPKIFIKISALTKTLGCEGAIKMLF